MANKTTNYNLTKPLASEFYDVEDQNGNMDKIDAELKKNADAIAGVKSGAITSAEREKLAGIESGANKYTHPATHPASMIEETEEIKMMTAGERSKLAGIAAGANKYAHPATHPASMITGLAAVALSGRYEDLSDKPDFNGLKMSLAWENASPNSEFGAQTLSTDFSQYTYVIIAYNVLNDRLNAGSWNKLTFSIGYVAKNMGALGSAIAFKSLYSRSATISSGKITFQTGYYQASSSSTGDAREAPQCMIPVFILGVK